MKLDNYLKKVSTYELKKLRKITDDIFSQYVRLKDAKLTNNVLINKCFTCGRIERVKARPPRGLECGHWQTRNKKKIRWNEDNCRPQCNYCNNVKKGEQSEFERRLRKEIGDNRVENIYNNKNLVINERLECLRVITSYKEEVIKILNSFGFKNWDDL